MADTPRTDLTWDQVQELHDQRAREGEREGESGNEHTLSSCWCCCCDCEDEFDVKALAAGLPDDEEAE